MTTAAEERLPGDEVEIIRRRLGLTQERFANLIGVTVSTVNRWENGHVSPSRMASKIILDAVEAHRKKGKG